jgi:hypothetical protein
MEREGMEREGSGKGVARGIERYEGGGRGRREGEEGEG